MSPWRGRDVVLRVIITSNQYFDLLVEKEAEEKEDPQASRSPLMSACQMQTCVKTETNRVAMTGVVCCFISSTSHGDASPSKMNLFCALDLTLSQDWTGPDVRTDCGVWNNPCTPFQTGGSLVTTPLMALHGTHC